MIPVGARSGPGSVAVRSPGRGGGSRATEGPFGGTVQNPQMRFPKVSYMGPPKPHLRFWKIFTTSSNFALSAKFHPISFYSFVNLSQEIIFRASEPKLPHPRPNKCSWPGPSKSGEPRSGNPAAVSTDYLGEGAAWRAIYRTWGIEGYPIYRLVTKKPPGKAIEVPFGAKSQKVFLCKMVVPCS